MPPLSNTEHFEKQKTQAALRASEARTAAVLEVALDCIVTIDHLGRILDWNPAAERTFGYSRAEAVGQEMAELIIPAAWRERHRMGLSRAVATGENTIIGQRIEITGLRADGSEFPVELAVTRIATDGQPLFTGHIRDITARKQAEQRQATQYAVARVLAEAASLDEAAPKILQVVCEGLQWDIGAIWHVDADRDVLRCVDLWHGNKPELKSFAEVTRQSTFTQESGLPGRIWASVEPCWIPDVTEDSNFPRAARAGREGLHSAFGFPIHLGEQVLGVMEFFSEKIRQPDAELLNMFALVGSQMGQFIKRARAEAEVRQLNADLERRIAASTAELRSTNEHLKTEMAALEIETNERKRAEARNRESQERFSKAFRASPVSVSIARLSDGRFVEVNEVFVNSSGYRLEEIIGRTSTELNLWVVPAERAKFFRQLQADGFVHGYEARLRSKGGRVWTLLLSAELIEFDGAPHILSVSLDISARKQAEEELQKAFAREKELSLLKSNFVTLVSHEFRTPLGIIMSASEILDSYLERLSPEKRREHLSDIQQATRQMSDLMEEVLLLGRVEAGKMQFRPDTLDVRDFCLRLVESVSSATNRQCPIEFGARKITDRASGDEALLRHIFTNLLSNGVKYSAPGRSIQFTVQRQSHEAVFQICDQGIGIPEEDLKHLFQAFHRGGNVGERPGSGLGLLIVQRCVELHGGRIDIASKVGQGTTVTVRLPLFEKEKRRAKAAKNKTKTAAPRAQVRRRKRLQKRNRRAVHKK